MSRKIAILGQSVSTHSICPKVLVLSYRGMRWKWTKLSFIIAAIRLNREGPKVSLSTR